MHIFLIGYRGCGKSTVGRLLAQQLQRPLADTDELIEKKCQQTIQEIFEAAGEAGFRDLEEDVIATIARSSREPHVVSLGGGAILRQANRQWIGNSGICIWLQGSPEALYARISSDAITAQQRPKLSDLGGYEEVVEVLRAREPLYRRMAQMTVITDDKTPDEVVMEILEWVKSQAEAT